MKNLLCALTCALALSTPGAQGQLTWGVNGGGGAGTWNTTNLNWWDGSTNVAWVNGGSAIFDGVGGTVGVGSGGVTASKLTFNVPGYVLAAQGSISGTNGLTVEANADVTINALIGGGVIPPSLTKTGAASVTVSNLLAVNRIAINQGEFKLTNLAAQPLHITYIFGDSSDAVLTLASSRFTTVSIDGLSGGGDTRGVVQPEDAVGTKTLLVAGPGGSFAGALKDYGAGVLSLAKSGTGLQELTGANTYSGATEISGGVLALSHGGSALSTAISIHQGALLLDNSAALVSDRVSDSAPITIAGNLTFTGNSAAPTTEALGPLTLGGDFGSVIVNPPSAQPATLTFESMAAPIQAKSGVIVFQGANLGASPGPGVASVRFNTAPVLLGGSGSTGTNIAILPTALGGTAPGSTFVTYDVNGIRPLTDAEYANDSLSIYPDTNLNLTTPQSVLFPVAVNSLRLQAGASIGGNNTLTIGSGAILARAGSGNVTVADLDFGSREAIITNETDLLVSSRIAGSSAINGLTKSGPGRLTLTGANTYTGATTVAQGILNIRNAAALGAPGGGIGVGAGAALEIQGGISLDAGPLTISDTGPDGKGSLRSLKGQNTWNGPVTMSNAKVDVPAGGLVLSGPLTARGVLTKTGPGALTLRGPLDSPNDGLAVRGGTVLSNATDGTPFGSGALVLNSGGVALVPGGSGADVSLLGATLPNSGTPFLTYGVGTARIALDRAANNSITFTLGGTNSFFAYQRFGRAALLISPASGVAALGNSERLKFAYSGGISPINGILSSSIVAQDRDANRSGDFVTYTGLAGFQRATYSSSNFLVNSSATTVFDARLPQTVTTPAAVYALKNSGQTITLTNTTLTFGGGGLIMNGGSITGGTLSFAAGGELTIYTSLAGGSISSAIDSAGTARTLTKFGPGTLTFSGTHAGNIVINDGALKLGSTIGGSISLALEGILSGTGAIAGPIAGGLISPGNSPGILTAGSTTPQSNLANGAPEGFVPTAYAFEFTQRGHPTFGAPAASGNDVLRLTNTGAPFSGTLTANNEIDVYLNPFGGPHPGDEFFGGFFTNRNASFGNSIADANWRVFLADASGDTAFNGVNYLEYPESAVEIASVAESANFGSGPVNGYITRIKVVPEPQTGVLLLSGSMFLLIGGRGTRSWSVRSGKRSSFRQNPLPSK
ncbi:MAG TPA: autotransporter-associated beta strand repeat-containing protein [Chthoniobacteraceae bacterium]|nr:autotransporter-associated beta strand repeat-containing protein [Chthoniobacteraceae bacterium]